MIPTRRAMLQDLSLWSSNSLAKWIPTISRWQPWGDVGMEIGASSNTGEASFYSLVAYVLTLLWGGQLAIKAQALSGEEVFRRY